MSYITVLGIGNILLSDEGFGVRVVEELQKCCKFPEEVEVLDGGTLGLDLLRFIKGTKKLVLLDAVDGGKEPGTLYHLTGDDVSAYFHGQVSLHELGIKDILTDLELTDKKVEEVVIIGVQPLSLEVGLELTPLIQGKVQAAVHAVKEELARWKVVITSG